VGNFPALFYFKIVDVETGEVIDIKDVGDVDLAVV
jgi:hypothetical protein